MNPSLVAFTPCPDYGPALAPALDTLLAHLGGWQALVKPGQKVLVKPNLLADTAPEQAVTTHPELVRQVIRGLKAAGARVQVGDSPASAMNLEQVWRRTGIQEVCAAEQVPLLSFEQGSTRQISRNGHVFTVASAAVVGVVVTLPLWLGPLVPVAPIAPAKEAPMAATQAAISSSTWSVRTS